MAVMARERKVEDVDKKNIPVTILIVLSSCMFKDQGLESSGFKIINKFPSSKYDLRGR